MSEDSELEFERAPEPDDPETGPGSAIAAATFDYVEYAAPDHEKWRVERGSDLIAEFALDGPEMLPVWHGAMTGGRRSEEEEQTWLILRRLYGIAPMMGVEDPNELRVWASAELATTLGLSERVVENHVTGAKMFWRRWKTENQRSDVGSRKPKGQKPDKDALPEEEVARLLIEQGFVDVESEDERRYIASRIMQLEPWLESEQLRGTARNLISQEIELFFVIDPSIRELRAKIKTVKVNTNTTSIPEKENRQLLEFSRARREVQSSLEATLKTLGMTEASGGGLKKKMGFGDFLSGLFDAVKAFKSQEDRGLIDGFFEAAEIEILTTPTTLRPIQYRPDLIVSLSEAVEHLWEADWSPTPVSRRACRTLNKAFGAALAAARAERGEVPRSDYPDDEPEGAEPVETSAAPPALDALRPAIGALARAAVAASRRSSEECPAMAAME